MPHDNLTFDLPLLLDDSFPILSKGNQYYGNLSFGFPTGRPNDVESIELNQFIGLVQNTINHSNEFNFLLNGDLSHLDISFFYNYFSWIINEVRPSVITFSHPSVYHYLVNEFKYTNLEISAIAGIRSIKGFKHFISKNNININHISKIVFHHDITRNYQEAIPLVEFLKTNGISPRVLVTESCYYNCALRKLHYSSFSEAYIKVNDEFINSYQIHCIAKRLLHPETILDLSGFLLPEQLGEYSKLSGINAFKISGRSESANWIYNTSQAYINGKSPDNLFEIIVFTSPLLEQLGLKVSDLFYLNSHSYFDLFKELVLIESKHEKQMFLQRKAIELYENKLLSINDPNSTYGLVNGLLKLVKKGEYLNLLEKNSNAALKGTVFFNSRELVRNVTG